MLTGFVSLKIISVMLGPEGLALTGQLTNFATIVMAVAAVGINQGVTKYVAEFGQDKTVLKSLISTAYRVTLTGSLACGLFMIVFNSFLGNLLLKTQEYNYVFVIFGITIVFYAMNNLLISIVNGFKQFRLYVMISIANSLLGLIYTVVFVTTMGLKGAFISFVTYQSATLLVTIVILRRTDWFRWPNFKAKLSGSVVRKYTHYSLMTLVSISVVPVSQLILRSYVIVNISGTEAGWWEAMNKLSSTYLMVITSSFAVYYLPRLSELQTNSELKHEIMKAYKVIMPPLIIGFVCIYFLRFFVIRILFTPDFYPMENLFIWQLSGDLFKIGSWLLAFLMWAKARTAAFISTEILSSALYLFLALFLIGRSGSIVGLVQAYTINYIVYMVVMVILFRKIILAR